MQSTTDRARRAVSEPIASATSKARAVAANATRVVAKVAPQVEAAANGAQDAFTFGLGDRAYAGVQAIDDAMHGQDFRSSYGRHYAGTQALDAYDAKYHPIARTVGQLAGTAAQVAALGPLEGIVAGGARIAEATPLIAREVTALGGAGAAGGVGGQFISDLSRGRAGSLGDYAGAAIGGAVGTLSARAGRAGRAGAAMGGVTSLAQDVLNGRISSIDDASSAVDRARQAALVGGVFGAVGGLAGRAWSNGLSRAEKGQLGEDFSRLRTWARGDQTLPGPKTYERLEDGGWTIPDQRTTGADIVESKFGPSARLSPRQMQAFNQPLDGYRVDHSLPSDVGILTGLIPADYGYHQWDASTGS
jgi:hypothetical protein